MEESRVENETTISRIDASRLEDSTIIPQEKSKLDSGEKKDTVNDIKRDSYKSLESKNMKS